MGTACNCSKSTQGIKETIPNATLTTQIVKPASAALGVTVEGQQQALATYKANNQDTMHKKIAELYNIAQANLSKGVIALKLNTLKMKEKDWAHFTNLLTYCDRMQRLSLWKVSLTAGTVNTLAAHLLLLERLEYLMLGDMNLGSLGLGAMAEAFKKLLQLKELILTVNYLNSEHLSLLLPALLQMRVLETLSLDENELGDRGAEIAARMIEKLPYLTDISMKFNSIGSKGLTALLPKVGIRRGLIVRLDGNDLNDDEYDLLEQAHNDAQA